MERKISFKNLYLIGVISIGLIGLGVGSTFAMFTASAEINDSISITSGLSYQDDIADLVEMSISSNDVETVTLNITNNTTETLNYTSWYQTDNNNIQIGTVVSNNNSVTGTIAPSGTVQIIVSVRNRGAGVAKVTVGISASEDDIIVEDGITTLPTDPLPPYLNDYITSLYTGATKSDVTNNSITYHYATSVNLMNDRLGDSNTNIDEGNIRYYGASPANYIDIGDRDSNDDPILWRIIGVFDGKVRVVRSASIGNYSWDSSPSTINNGDGINEWSQADVMKLLNPGYSSETVGGSLWYNSGSGYCYDDCNNSTTACNFTSTGLSNVAKANIISQTLYLGAFNTHDVYADEAYATERGTATLQNPADNIVRTTIWTGKVGLPYPSDYGYSTDFSDTNCQRMLSNYNDDNCTANWIDADYAFMISPYILNPIDVMILVDYLAYNEANESQSIWPTLLLDPKVVLESGTGTSQDPYVID